MTFSMTLTIKHPGLSTPIQHIDMIQARSMAAALKHLELSAEEICDLKNYGVTSWMDRNGALHTLEMKHEAV